MSALRSLLVLVAALLAVFGQAACPGTRPWLGAQANVLPALMVYAALETNLTTVALLAACGGLWFDALSANPLGVTMLPLFVVGLALYTQRGLVLRAQVFAQSVLGVAASAAVPALTLVLLLTAGYLPLVGWGSLWQWLVVSLAGGLLAPLCFQLLGGCVRALSYRPARQTSFRADRDIRRGRR
jgi:cell shape-determining protein MreD